MESWESKGVYAKMRRSKPATKKVIKQVVCKIPLPLPVDNSTSPGDGGAEVNEKGAEVNEKPIFGPNSSVGIKRGLVLHKPMSRFTPNSHSRSTYVFTKIHIM